MSSPIQLLTCVNPPVWLVLFLHVKYISDFLFFLFLFVIVQDFFLFFPPSFIVLFSVEVLEPSAPSSTSSSIDNRHGQVVGWPSCRSASSSRLHQVVDVGFLLLLVSSYCRQGFLCGVIGCVLLFYFVWYSTRKETTNLKMKDEENKKKRWRLPFYFFSIVSSGQNLSVVSILHWWRLSGFDRGYRLSTCCAKRMTRCSQYFHTQ